MDRKIDQWIISWFDLETKGYGKRKHYIDFAVFHSRGTLALRFWVNYYNLQLLNSIR